MRLSSGWAVFLEMQENASYILYMQLSPFDASQYVEIILYLLRLVTQFDVAKLDVSCGIRFDRNSCLTQASTPPPEQKFPLTRIELHEPEPVGATPSALTKFSRALRVFSSAGSQRRLTKLSASMTSPWSRVILVRGLVPHLMV